MARRRIFRSRLFMPRCVLLGDFGGVADSPHPFKTLINPDLRHTCVQIVCPDLVRRCFMTLEFAPHFTRTTHVTGSRFPRPPPETVTRKSDNKTIRGSFCEA